MITLEETSKRIGYKRPSIKVSEHSLLEAATEGLMSKNKLKQVEGFLREKPYYLLSMQAVFPQIRFSFGQQDLWITTHLPRPKWRLQKAQIGVRRDQ